MKITLLLGNWLLRVKVPTSVDVCDVFDAAKSAAREEEIHGVDEYVGNLVGGKMRYYRLEPPPVVKDFTLHDDDSTVDDVEAVLATVKTVRLSKLDMARELVDAGGDISNVLLYIEKPPGKPSAACSGDLSC